MIPLPPALRRLSDAAFVSALYHLLLGRMPDAGGYRNYVEQLAAGVEREALWSAVAGSAEARERRDARARVAAPAEAPVDRVATSLLELVGLPRDIDFVRAAYVTLLGREADVQGLEHYAAALAGGLPREEVICSLATSEEGRARGTAVPGLRDLLQARERAAHPVLGPWWAVRSASLRLTLAEAQIAGLREALRVAESEREPSQWELVARLDDLERRLEGIEQRPSGVIPDTLAWLASLAAVPTATAPATTAAPAEPTWSHEVSRIDRAGRALHAGIREAVMRRRAAGHAP